MYKLHLEKAEEPVGQIANICWILEEAKKFQKKIPTSASLTMLKPLAVQVNNKVWKILKEMGIPGHFTCLLCMQVKKQ